METDLTWLFYLLGWLTLVNTGASQQPTPMLACNSSRTSVDTHIGLVIISTATHALPNITCDFHFAPLMTREFLHIETMLFDLQNSPGCRDEYLEIFADERSEPLASSSGQLVSIGRWCGQSYARFVDIRGPVKVRYVSNLQLGKGFKINIIAKTESNYTRPSSEQLMEVGSTPAYIYSPGYPTEYLSGLSLTWKLRAKDASHVIYLDFLDFHLEISSDCSYDSLTITTTNSSTNISTRSSWCGDRGPKFLAARGSVDLLLVTDDDVHQTGFAIRVYSMPPQNTSCTGSGVRTLTAHALPQMLSLPAGQNKILECLWLLQSPNIDDVIILEVVDWDHDVLTCGSDPLEIHDGNGEADLQLVSSCGSAIPFGFLRTSGRATLIKSGLHVTRGSAILRGFNIKFYARNKFFFDEDSLEAVKSRSYAWIPVIKHEKDRPALNLKSADSTRCVSVEVRDKWAHKITDAYHDYIDAYDVSKPSPRLMGACATDATSAISSTTDSLKVKVKVPVDDGFWLTIDTTANCHGDTIILEVKEHAQKLSFPPPSLNSTVNMDAPIECHWKLEKGHSGLLLLETEDMVIEADGSCTHSYLKASDGDHGQNLINKKCHHSLINLTSLSDIYLELRLRNDLSADRFVLSYSKDTHYTCSNVQLYATSEWQYLSSPGYPALFPNAAHCRWTIRSQHPRNTINLEMITLYVYGLHCQDHVDIYDGDEQGDLLAKFCKNGFREPTLHSSGPRVLIEFKSDLVTSTGRFRLAFYSVEPIDATRAPDLLTAGSQIQMLMSPGFPDIYDSGKEKTWLISAAHNNHVTIAMDKGYQNVYSKPCRNSHDVLDVYNGRDTAAPLLGHLCGEGRVTMIQVTSSAYIFLRLLAAEASVATGFSGKFKISYFTGMEHKACLPGVTTTLTAMEYWQYLVYPQDAEHYPKNAECAWRIDGGNATVTFEVTASDLEDSYTCIYDLVKVFDGFDSTSHETGVWCGLQMPKFYSSGRYLFLLFVTDGMDERSGFTIRYRLTPSHVTTTPATNSANTSIGMIVGLVLVGIFTLIIVIIISLGVLSRTRRARRHREDSHREPTVYNRSNSTVFVVSPVFVEASVDAAPPPYPGISNPAYSSGPPDELPPSYPAIDFAEPSSPSISAGVAVSSNEDSVLPAPPPYTESSVAQESPPTYESAVSEDNLDQRELQRINSSENTNGNSRRDAAHGHDNPVGPTSRTQMLSTLGPV